MSRPGFWGGLPFAVSVERRPGRLVARLHGELDLATAPALEQALADALASIDGGGSVEVVWLDLAALRFIDVAGARAIHHCEELARARGLQFVASEASRQARFVFEVCGLTDYARPN